MEKLTILGTGCAMVTKCYNTCFTLSDENEHLLVDAGGGNTILSNLEKTNIPINKIHNIFVSHNHNDHVLGVVWVIRAVAQGIINNKYDDNLHIYCHKEVAEALRTISGFVLNKKFTKFFDNRILFHEIYNNYETEILGRKVTFFDIQSTKDLQFGFTTTLLNGKTLTFLGDEPYRDALKSYSENVDYLLHEAYCLYSQKEKFKPYEKHHVTVKDACENAEKLNVKAIILYHTEDKNITNRKELYITEGREFFANPIFVPDDLDIIYL